MHRKVEHQTSRIEQLIRQLESSADPDTLAVSRELVQNLMELYGAGLERIAEIIASRGQSGLDILDDLGRDELVGNLMAANGVHPLDLDARVQQAVDRLRDRLRSQGSVELLGVDAGVVRLRLRPKAQGCGSSPGAFQLAVEEAMVEAAPDLIELAIEVIEEPGAAAGFVPLASLVGQPAVNGNGTGL
jgi:Fe-S cluster biogenesis protein NfuA